MLTYGELLQAPHRFVELHGKDVLVGAAGAEVVIHKPAAGSEATMVFMHETIAMMRAERAEQLEKLRRQIGAQSLVVPLTKRASGFWDQVILGRASTADIVLDDPAVSNVHAHFVSEDGGQTLSVQDVGSSNGTFINRQPLQPHIAYPLRSGDCIRFGQTVFYFVAHASLRYLLEELPV